MSAVPIFVPSMHEYDLTGSVAVIEPPVRPRRRADVFALRIWNAPLSWVVGLVASVLRVVGEVRAPARISLFAAALVLPLSPALIFGVGQLPRLVLAGVGLSVMARDALTLAPLSRYLRDSIRCSRCGRCRSARKSAGSA